MPSRGLGAGVTRRGLCQERRLRVSGWWQAGGVRAWPLGCALFPPHALLSGPHTGKAKAADPERPDRL